MTRSIQSLFWAGLLVWLGCAAVAPDAEMLKSDARWALAQGRPSEALRVLRRATELAPRDAEVFVLLGRVALREERPAEAEIALARAIELDPRDAGLRVARGQALKRLGRYAEAESTLLHALLLQPAHPPTLVSLAELYRLWGQPEKCMARYGQFLWQIERLERDGALEGSHEGPLRLARDRERHCSQP